MAWKRITDFCTVGNPEIGRSRIADDTTALPDRVRLLTDECRGHWMTIAAPPTPGLLATPSGHLLPCHSALH